MATTARPDLRRIHQAVIGAAKGFAKYDREADELGPEMTPPWGEAMERREKALRLLREVTDLLIEAEGSTRR